MRQFEAKTPKTVRKALNLREGATDSFLIFDSLAEFADKAMDLGGGSENFATSYRGGWFGNKTTVEAIDLCTRGDVSLAAPSDKLLDKFEGLTFPTTGRAWSDDVVGSFPNVPAFIAGIPANMRRRKRLCDMAFAPIAIIADVVLSCSCSAEQMARRGAAILALARGLSARRPVELWVAAGLEGNRGNACYIAARIETAPLDIGVAAFALTDIALPRRLMYGIGQKQYSFDGHWPYRKDGAHRAHMPEIWKAAFEHVGETLCIEAMHTNDLIATEPEKWIEEQINRLAPVDLSEVA